MQKYLEVTEIIDYHNAELNALALRLAKNCETDEQIAKNCFEYVRDEIRHSGDYKDNITTATASEVLKHKTGWCYAKAFLLAGLLRANGIPTGLPINGCLVQSTSPISTVCMVLTGFT